LRPLEVSFDSGHTYAQDEADDKSKSCDELERQLARTKATTKNTYCLNSPHDQVM
jgi:hypothetical protein